MKTALVLLALSLALGGCATSPTPVASATPVPASRIYLHPTPNETSAHVVIVRDTGLQGGGVYAHLFVNGAEAAAFSTGEMLRIPLPQGDVNLGVHLTDPLHAENVISIDQNLKPGQTYYYRIMVDHNGARLQRFFPN